MIVLDGVSSIFDLDAEALVNPVNCVGVAGKGLALKFKTRFPENFRFYKMVCDRGHLKPGDVLQFQPRQESRHIFNLATKDHWRDPSQLEWIEAGLRTLVSIVEYRGVRSIAIPALGCGLGGLSWGQVEASIRNAFQPYNEVTVTLLPPRRQSSVAFNLWGG